MNVILREDNRKAFLLLDDREVDCKILRLLKNLFRAHPSCEVSVYIRGEFVIKLGRLE